MNNREKYQRAFSAIHPSTDYLEKIVKTEDSKMKEKRRVSFPKLLAACVAVIAILAAMSAAAYAVDIGGIQRRIQIWVKGELTDAELNITTDGQYSYIYTDEDGESRKIEGGGVAYDFFGRERPLTEDEIIEHINSPQLSFDENNNTVMLSCRDQKVDITDKFEDGVCYVKLTVDGKPLYVTVTKKGDTGYSMSTDRHSYPKP